MTSPWVPQPSGREGWHPAPEAGPGPTPQPWPAQPGEPWPQATAPWPAYGGPTWDPFAVSRRESLDVRKNLPAAALIVVALAIAGAIAGFVWHATSARPRVIEGPGGSLQLPAQNDKNYFGADASFFAVAAAAGVVSGGLVYSVARSRGPAIPVALAVGSVAAGLVMRAVGESQVTNATLASNCGRDPRFDGVCTIYEGHLELRVAGMSVIWAITALAVYTALLALAFWAARRRLALQQPAVPAWEPPGIPTWQPPEAPAWPPPPSWPPNQ